MNRRCYILVPGILTRTEDLQAWCVRMVDDIMRWYPHTYPAATEFRYFAGALTRRWRQQSLARQLAAVISQWARSGFEIVLVGHSNGCDLIQRALRLGGAKVLAVHLIAAASDPDLDRAGYIDKLQSGLLGTLHVYYSAGDSALSRWARLSQLGAVLGLGYGRLGEIGPRNVPEDMEETRVIRVQRDYLDHGDWFSPSHYKSTLEAITVHESLHQAA